RRGELKIEERWKIDEKAEVGNLWLHGYVEWSEQEAVPQGDVQVRVWVNDFEQFGDWLGDVRKVRADPRSDPVWRRTFKAEVRLNRSHNRVQLGFSEAVKLESNEQLEFTVDCTQPEKHQRLHLLAVALGRGSQKDLHARLRKA